MAKSVTESMTFSVVIEFLVIVVPLAGLLTGYIPSRGIDPTLENNPIKFYLVLALWFGISLTVAFNVVVKIHNLFMKFGGNYNWATFKAVLRSNKDNVT
jgi:uncharacterized membrane protein YraQ (UPF0718 family)